MSTHAGTARPAGNLTIVRAERWPEEPGLRDIVRHAFPRPGLPKGVAAYRARNFRNVWRGLWRVLAARALRVPHHYGVLYIDVRRGDGTMIPVGLVSLRVVTDAGVNKIVALLNQTDAATGIAFKFHGLGTGTNAEAVGDTALQTELTTQYAPDNTRPTGTQTVGGTNNVYRTVATITPDSGGTIAVTEHGIFSQAATGGGTLLDRSKFAAVNLDTTQGDNIVATYDFTIASGG